MFSSPSRPSAIITLILANLVPLAGVLFLNWSAFSIVLLYWLESLIIGFWNVLKMAKAQGRSKDGQRPHIIVNKEKVYANARPLIIVFFLIHYGIFMMGHGFFIVIFMSILDQSSIDPLGILAGFVSLFVSHGISFLGNYIGNKEYERVSINQQMMKPYGRVFIMQFVIVFGSFLAITTQSPQIFVAFLVVLKIIADLGGHFWEHHTRTREAEIG